MELIYFYLISVMLGGLLGYLWNDDVYQKEKNELLLLLIDKMRDSKEFESQKEWLLSELKKTKEWGGATFEVNNPDGNLTSKVTASVGNQTSKVTA